MTHLEKLLHYCGYQERCLMEVREKMETLEIPKDDQETMVKYLITHHFLNQERFAKSYAGGKFRIKQWGKIKIIQALKQKQISPELISIALKEIPDTDYIDTIEKLALKKANTSKPAKNDYEKTLKIAYYLAQKGYENDLCMHAAKKTILNNLQ